MTRNQAVLATVQAEAAINKARQAQHTEPAEQGVMQCLSEAIAERRAELVRMVIAGHAGTAEYGRASRQLEQWVAAWRRNR